MGAWVQMIRTLAPMELFAECELFTPLSKAPPFLGNLAKKSERNGRNGNPRKSDSDTGKR